MFWGKAGVRSGVSVGPTFWLFVAWGQNLGHLQSRLDKGEFRRTYRLPSRPQSSSICRAAIHYGILDAKGGLVDVTRNGKVPFFVRSERNGVESLR